MKSFEQVETGDVERRRARFDRKLVLGTWLVVGAAAMPFGCGGHSERREEPLPGAGGAGGHAGRPPLGGPDGSGSARGGSAGAQTATGGTFAIGDGSAHRPIPDGSAYRPLPDGSAHHPLLEGSPVRDGQAYGLDGTPRPDGDFSGDGGPFPLPEGSAVRDGQAYGLDGTPRPDGNFSRDGGPYPYDGASDGGPGPGPDGAGDGCGSCDGWFSDGIAFDSAEPHGMAHVDPVAGAAGTPEGPFPD